MNVTREVKNHALKIVVYGSAGVGKSTLIAALFNKAFPAVIDGDDSYSGDLAGQIDVSNESYNNDSELKVSLDQFLQDVIAGKEQHKSLIFDTVGYVQDLFADSVLKMNPHWESMASLDFGRCWVPVQEKFKKFLGLLDQIHDAGIHIGLIAHSDTKDVDTPDLSEKITKYKPLLNNKIAEMIIAWSDATFFIYNSIDAYSVDAGWGQTKAKATDKSTKFIVCSDTPYAIAKNRHGLPNRIPFDKTPEMTVDDLSNTETLLHLVESLKITPNPEVKAKGIPVFIPKAAQQQPQAIVLPPTAKPTPTVVTKPVPVVEQPPVASVTPAVIPTVTEKEEPGLPLVQKAIFPIELFEKTQEAGITDEEFRIIIASSKSNSYTVDTQIDQYETAYLDDLLKNKWDIVLAGYNAQKPLFQAKGQELKEKEKKLKEQGVQ